MNKEVISKSLLSNLEAADYLSLSFRTLNNSRHTGILCGRKAPAYLKIGKTIRYKKQNLDEWLTQFNQQTNTGEDAA